MKYIKAKFTISDLDGDVIIEGSCDIRTNGIKEFEKDLRVCISGGLSYVGEAQKEGKGNLHEAFESGYKTTSNLVFKNGIDLSNFITESMDEHIDKMFTIKIETELDKITNSNTVEDLLS